MAISSEVRAVCGNTASTDPRGGLLARAVPTANGDSTRHPIQRRWHPLGHQLETAAPFLSTSIPYRKRSTIRER